MENSKGSRNVRNLMYTGKQAWLPPKSPFPSGSMLCTDYVPGGLVGSKAVQKPREGNANHHRTSSESFLMEEQPSWLDDLLDEPETPVRKGHRRSSSDSFAYVDVADASNKDCGLWDDHRYRNILSVPGGGSRDQEFDYHKDARPISFYTQANLLKEKNRVWEPLSNSGAQPSSLSSAWDSIPVQSSGSSCAPRETEGVSCIMSENKDRADCISKNPGIASSEKKDDSHTKLAASEAEIKCTKQRYAQRSRVRKLQYIAELERNLEALQAEGSEVSAELEFLNQQHLILGMENKALKQRLESVAQEQLIKHLEHEVLEKEIARLRALYEQQQQRQKRQEQQPQQPKKSSSRHRRASSRELECQFASLSLKQNDANSGHDHMTGSIDG